MPVEENAMGWVGAITRTKSTTALDTWASCTGRVAKITFVHKYFLIALCKSANAAANPLRLKANACG
jgi:hypothetical protein